MIQMKDFSGNVAVIIHCFGVGHVCIECFDWKCLINNLYYCNIVLVPAMLWADELLSAIQWTERKEDWETVTDTSFCSQIS